jgi:hypothetical protein
MAKACLLAPEQTRLFWKFHQLAGILQIDLSAAFRARTRKSRIILIFSLPMRLGTTPAMHGA